MARFGYSLVDGFTVGSVPASVIKHVEVRRGCKEVFLEIFWSFVFFDNDPFGVTRESVEFELIV